MLSAVGHAKGDDPHFVALLANAETKMTFASANLPGLTDNLQVTGKEKRLPAALSGGERQRVALARVLVRERPVLLLDEPFASLGPALRRDMLELVAALQRERQMTVLFVTHQPEDAERLADHVIFLDGGTVAAAGPAVTFFGAASPEVFRRYAGSVAGTLQ